MGLFTRKETGPKEIRCPNCGGTQEASASAQSVVCRQCNTTIKIADQKISNYSATVAVEIFGDLVVEKKGALVVQKRVVASNLDLKGSLKGNTIIYDSVHIGAGAQLAGDLKARVLEVEDGAALKGHLTIVPANGGALPDPPREVALRMKA
ncbi:MAG TPA: polymer-forming cytoskeletal protein [Planctomycetota bacterium]|nr:polymer-forming cytoskeletal protein [Planctomycetota bacterium]